MPSASHALMPAVPSLLMLLVMLLFSASSFLPAYGMLYYWMLFMPGALPLFSLALLGLLHDVLYGLPLGVSLCQFALIAILCAAARRRVLLSHYVAVWMLFAPVMLVMFALACLLQSWLTGAGLERLAGAYAVAFFLSWLCYPLLSIVLTACYRRMPSERAAS